MSRRAVAVCLLVSVLALVATWAAMGAYLGRLTADVSAWVAAREAEWSAVETERAAVFGGAETGRAWDAYERAIERVGAMSDEDQDLLFRIMDPDQAEVAAPVTPSEIRGLLDRHVEVVTELLRGVARSDLEPPYGFRDSFDWIVGDAARGIAMNTLCQLALLDADTRWATDPVESVVLRTAVMTFGLDVAHGPTLMHEMFGESFATEAAKGWTDDSLAALPVDAAAMLASGLERVAQRVSPRSFATRFDAAVHAAALIDLEDSTWSLPMEEFSWGTRLRYLFSQRYLRVAAAATLRDAADGWLRVTATDWSARRQAFEAAGAVAVASGNPLVHYTAPNFEGIERARRALLAELRMLQMAVDWHHREVVRPLPDPFSSRDLMVEELAGGGAVIRTGDGAESYQRALAPR